MSYEPTNYINEEKIEEIKCRILNTISENHKYSTEQEDYIVGNKNILDEMTTVVDKMIDEVINICDKWLEKEHIVSYIKSIEEKIEQIHKKIDLCYKVESLTKVIKDNIDSNTQVRIDVIPSISNRESYISIALCVDDNYLLQPETLYSCEEDENVIEVAYIIYRYFVGEQSFPVSLEEISVDDY